MEVYETEEQQIKALKEWWNENGTSIIVGIVLGVGGYLGYQFWQSQTAQKNQEASSQYSALLEIDATAKTDEFAAAANALKGEHADTGYAILAALHLAKSAADKDDFASAEAELRWAVGKADGLDVQPVITVRLARVLNAQQRHAEAISLLEGVKNEAFKGLVQQVLGDSYRAKGDDARARTAYELAKESTESFAAKNELEMLVNDLQPASTIAVATPEAETSAPAKTDESNESNTQATEEKNDKQES